MTMRVTSKVLFIYPRAAKLLASLNFTESSIPLNGLLPKDIPVHDITSELPNTPLPFTSILYIDWWNKKEVRNIRSIKILLRFNINYFHFFPDGVNNNRCF